MSAAAMLPPPWPGLLPPVDAVVPVPARPGRAAREAAGRAAALPSGAPVLLVDRRPLGRRRTRRFAALAGVRLEREWVALPTAAHPVVLAEDGEVPLGWVRHSLLAVPPGAPSTVVSALALWLLRDVLPWRWLGSLAPGRVALGRRT